MSQAPTVEAGTSRSGLRALRAARYALKVPPIPRDFRADIEGMRAIAVLVVMLWHAGVPFVPGGFAGVDIFFVVSGFLMTALLLQEGRARGRIDIAAFYARRARRLLPAALSALAGTAVLTLLTIPQSRWAEIGGDIVAAAAYLVNWRMADSAVSYLDLSRAPSPVQHYWSLAVEEQFYIVWPLVLLVLLLLARGRAKVFIVGSWVLAIVLLVGSLALSWWWTATYPEAAYFVTPTRIYELMLGGVVALGSRAWPRIPALLGAVLGWLGLGMVVASFFVLDHLTPFPGTAALLPTVGAALVLIAGFTGASAGPVAALRPRPLQWIGRLSYSLYLWHWPFLAAAASLARVGRGGPDVLPVHWGLLAVLISVIPAWLSFRFVEDPIRRHGRILRRVMGPGVATWQTLRLGLNCTLAGVLLGLGLLLLAPPSISGTTVAWRSPEIVESMRAGSGDGGEAAGRALAGGGTLGRVGADEVAPEETLPPAPPAPPSPPPVPERVGTLAVPLEQVPEDRPVMEPDGCFPGLTQTRAGICLAGDEDGEITIALFGDSHASMWLTAMDDLGREHGWRIASVARSSCPPTQGLVFAEDREPVGYAQCLDYQENAWEALLGTDPDVVMLSSARYDAPAEEVAAALARRVDGLRAAGALPVLVRDVPRPDFDVPGCLTDNRDDVPACAFDLDDGLARSGTGHAELLDLRPGLPVIDLTDQICLGPVCSPIVDDTVVWRDSNHLAATFVRSLAGELGSQVLPWVAFSQLPEPAGSLLVEGGRLGTS